MNQWKSILAGAVILSAASAGAAEQRSYSAAHFVLTLDGKGDGGLLRSVEGGAIRGEVIAEPAGTGLIKKHVAGVKYEDFSMSMGFDGDKGLLDWVSDTVDGKIQRKNGAITQADFDYRERSRREFQDALLTEVTMPACDASSKDPAYMTVKIAPEVIRSKKGDGSKRKIDARKQKQWLPCNFRLSIPGVDCTGVKKVEAFTIKQTVARDDIGDARDYVKTPGRIEYPNLRFIVPENSANDFVAWHEDFVINGNNEEDKEKTMTLSYLSADGKVELAKATMYNAGIYRIEWKAEASRAAASSVVIDLYVERMEIDFMAQFE